MIRNSIIVLSFLCIVMAFVVPTWESTSVIFGTTQGNFSVSDAGSANYSIPITGTPGTAGVSPRISLTYNNQGGNGLLGLGWSIDGLSTISRGGKSIAQDSLVKNVQLTNEDTYNIDGERLISVNGPYGSDDTEYRTEQNAMIRLKSFGSVNGSPEKWIAYTKSGLIMEYGYTEDSKIEAQGKTDILFWLVNKVYDTKGNYYTIQYQEDINTGEYYPVQIQYTGNDIANLSPYASIQFNYEIRPDLAVEYLNGSMISRTKRISSINTYYGNLLYRSYTPSYGEGNYHSVSLMTSIQECSGDNTCFNPTVFSWIAEDQFQMNIVNDGNHLINNLMGSYKVVYNGDWNGDGKTDMMVHNTSNGAQTWFKNSSNFNFLDSIAHSVININDVDNANSSFIPGDYNSDGYDDLLYFNPANGSNTWFLNNASSEINNLLFTKQDDLIPQIETPNDGNVYPADFNGDGLTDILYYKKNDGFNKLYINTTDTSSLLSFSPTTSENLIPSNLIQDGTDIHLLDYNADGLVDILWYDKDDGSTNWFENIDGETFNSPEYDLITKDSISGGTKIAIADFNGDGVSDIYWYNRPNGKIRINLNKGDNTFLQSAINFPFANITTNNGELSALDFNGDNLADFLFLVKNIGVNRWFLNDGNLDFTRALDPNNPTTPGYANPIPPTSIDNGTDIRITSFGKGLLDVFWYRNINGASRCYTNSISTYHLIDTITNGIGFTQSIEYKQLTDESDLYQKDFDAIYPQYDFTGKLNVVCSYRSDNGIGGKNKISYCYKGAKLDLHGRGFRGFTNITSIDSVSGIIESKTYDKDYRFVTAPIIKTSTYLPDSTLIKNTINQNSLINYVYPNQPKVHYAYVEESTVSTYEVDSSLVNVETSFQEFDDYGNLTNVVIDHGGGYRDSTVNFYHNHVLGGFWQLGRLYRTEVYKFSPNNETVKRVSEFDYDLNSGLLNKEVVEPDIPIDSQIVKTYIHDPYGNILESHITAHNGQALETRSTYSSYDNKGRFELTTTNSVGHISSSKYDPLLGIPYEHTDINGLITSKEFDGFGRQTRIDLPDGNWSTSSYNFCNAQPNCPQEAIYFVQQDFSNNPSSILYYDILDRELRSTSIGFNGQKIFADKVYNAKGQVSQSSEPYYNGEQIYWSHVLYDILDRDTLIISPGNRTLRKQYNGFTTTSFNPLNEKRTVILDHLGRMTQSIDNDNNILSYSYDGQGNLKETLDPLGNILSNQYDIFNRKISSSDPDMGTFSYQYNMFGELIKQIDADGDTTKIIYDEIGRILTRIEKQDTSNWVYDVSANGIGALSSAHMSNGYAKEFVYDLLSRITDETETIDSIDYTTSYTFDAKGRIEQVTYPMDSLRVSHIYNSYDYLQEIRNAVDHSLFWKADSISAKGLLVKESLGNNLSTIHSYDQETNFLQSIFTSDGIDTIQHLSYQFNDIGHLLNRSDIKKSVSESFGYDNLNRLTSSHVTGHSALTYEYDVLGNITYKSDVGSYTYAENGEGPRTLTKIDLINGAICIPSAQTKFTYTSFDKVNSITKGLDKLNIEYGIDRQRILQRTYKGESLLNTRIHAGGSFERVVTDSTDTYIYYIRGTQGVVANYSINIINGHSNIKYWHKDHLGSVSVITDDLKVIQEEFSYDAWGKRRNVDWSSVAFTSVLYAETTQRGFTGHEHIDLFSLINMNGRIYDPVIGRFISPDPHIQDISNLQNLNRYIYVLNNPLSYTDPSGFFLGSIFKVVKNVFKSVKSFVKKHFVTIVSIGIGLLTAGAGLALAGLTNAFGTLSYAFVSAAGFGFGSSFSGTLFAGGSIGDALKSGLKAGVIAGVTAAATFGVGEALGHVTDLSNVHEKIISHGLVQGATEEFQGGKFAHGFLAGGLAAAAQPIIGAKLENFSSKLIASSVVGGTASVIGGGKFENGAVSGAFVFLYNEYGSSQKNTLKERARNIANSQIDNYELFLSNQATRNKTSFIGFTPDRRNEHLYDYFTKSKWDATARSFFFNGNSHLAKMFNIVGDDISHFELGRAASISINVSLVISENYQGDFELHAKRYKTLINVYEELRQEYK